MSPVTANVPAAELVLEQGTILLARLHGVAHDTVTVLPSEALRGGVSRVAQDRSRCVESRLSEPMAVVGMGMRLPGKVRSEDDFWNFLINKKDGVCPGARDPAVLDSAASLGLGEDPMADVTDSTARILVLSASSSTWLSRRVMDLNEFINEKPPVLQDLAFTLAMRREHLNHRTFHLVQADGAIDRGPETTRCL
ncbi:hypothetical protein BBP40_001396 [Aspergillus hancockii]|nr:hypothetical protein BBP40_001396 [Aspergillus hancockii]